MGWAIKNKNDQNFTIEMACCFLIHSYVCVVAILPLKYSPGVQRGAIDQGDNSSNSFDKGGVTELEQILKQKTFTR